MYKLDRRRRGPKSYIMKLPQSHCFADEFGITHAHSFGTDTKHDYSQGKCRTISSIKIKLE